MKKYGRPLAIGVTPGKASMARNASPKAPGSCRTCPTTTVVWPGSGRWPWTLTSATTVAVEGAGGGAGSTADGGGGGDGESARAAADRAHEKATVAATTARTRVHGAIDE
jgi:hypothetical protein